MGVSSDEVVIVKECRHRDPTWRFPKSEAIENVLSTGPVLDLGSSVGTNCTTAENIQPTGLVLDRSPPMPQGSSMGLKCTTAKNMRLTGASLPLEASREVGGTLVINGTTSGGGISGTTAGGVVSGSTDMHVSGTTGRIMFGSEGPPFFSDQPGKGSYSPRSKHNTQRMSTPITQHIRDIGAKPSATVGTQVSVSGTQAQVVGTTPIGEADGGTNGNAQQGGVNYVVAGGTVSGTSLGRVGSG